MNLQELIDKPGYGSGGDCVRKYYTHHSTENTLRDNYKAAWCKAHGKTEDEWDMNGFGSHIYSPISVGKGLI